MSSPDLACPAARAALALDLLAVDPGLGGIVLRARSGPVRQAVLDHAARIGGPGRVVHPQIGDEALFGGIDLAATLAGGRIVAKQGLLDAPARLTLTMAERCPPGLAARLAAALDAGTGHVVIALDEGLEDEACPHALADRLAFRAELDSVAPSALLPFDRPDPVAARQRLMTGQATLDLHRQVTELALAFGIEGLRGPILAVRAARALAALRDRPLGPEELETAAALVLAHRATRLPEREAEDEPPPDPPPGDPPEGDGDARTEERLDIPDEVLVEAVRAAIPPDLMERLRLGARRGATGSGAGARRTGNRRGRPLPSRPGRPGDGARVDLVATLRTAAPWQTLRRREAPDRTGLQVRASDIRMKRYEDRSDRLLIFAVDASGSAAMARLAEAKGAIEILLAEAYARRDHVALVGFRGTEADVLLPPTRSLVQTKRRLAAMAGGGATPLAAGLDAALREARAAERRGLAPTICLLTDGRANVALDGATDRARAAEDAARLGRIARSAGVPALVLDCGQRPASTLRELAHLMDAPYLALPRADAARLSGAVAAALGD